MELSKCFFVWTIGSFKQNHEANKEKEQSKHTCACGGKYTHNHKAQHEKTQKHMKYLEEQNITI